jgi:thiol-disulfide isomerase/thioredoxin
MIKKLLAISLTALVLTGCSGGGTSTAEESYVAGNGTVSFIKPSARVAAPKLSGMTLKGVNYTFTPGKVAVVNVWASWCAPCRAEAPTLAALSEKYSDTSFIGVLTRDNPATAEAFARRFALPYPTLIDDSVLIGFRGSLPANAIPSTVVIDKSGKVAARISGEVTVASLSQLIENVSAE